MTRTKFAGLGLGLMAFSAASTAMAAGDFDRDRNVSVRERPRPEYQARGLPLGAFTAFPKLTVGAGRNDNIYASNTNEKSDTIYSLQPELVIQSGWSRNLLQAFVHGGRDMYADFPKESSTTYQYGFAGYVEAGDAKVTGGADFGQYIEPRTAGTSPGSTAKPVRYSLGQANLGLQYTLNRLRLSGQAATQKFNYKNGRTTTGALVIQDNRDRTVNTYTARAEYAVSPDTAVFVTGVLDNRNYDLQPPATALNRDSKGTNIAVGANFDLSALMRGELQVGYVNQDYKSAAFKNVKGVSTKGLIEWFPSELDTVSLNLSRGVEDATVPGSSGFMSGNYSIQIDHELLRNLIITGRAGIGKDEYEGIARTDDKTLAYVGANYLLNRGVGVSLSYDYLRQTSSLVTGPSFTANRVMLSSTLQF